MSYYKHLQLPIPIIAYSVLHQSALSVQEDDYRQTMIQLHQRIRSEWEAINTSYNVHRREANTRETELLFNSLSEFLQTPLRSDAEEVRRILGETFERVHDHMGISQEYRLIVSTETRIMFDPLDGRKNPSYIRTGMEYLASLGIDTSSKAGTGFESSFIVTGGTGLDLIEYVVRDRLGIYSDPHGKHIREFAHFSAATYNLILGDIPEDSHDIPIAPVEMSIVFSKPPIEYAAFRGMISVAIAEMIHETPIRHATLWQRKLGLGRGKEFVLRCSLDNTNDCESIIDWIDGRSQADENLKRVFERSGVILKEIVSD